MTSTATSTLFPLGAYLGNPNNASASEQALYDAKYDAFVSVMGTTPQFMATFVDQNQGVAQWVGNSMWAASSMAASVRAATMTPVIALPFSSMSAGAGTQDLQFKLFASGAEDAVIRGVVKAWTDQGFKNLVFRPGWEMNLLGSNYAGDDTTTQADWVKAFQHVYGVLHSEATAQGASMQVVWNPNVTNYTNANATGNLYPGDAYVDIIGADMYSDMHPFSDASTPSYHDWSTGGQDTTVASFIASAANRLHYWSSPAATQWSDDSSGGHSQTLASLMAFAQAHGKPFAIPETGAGNSDGGTDVKDDPEFPKWLAQQLAAAQAGGLKIAFVNLWDSNGGGNYEFSAAANGKPLEAAAWAAAFGSSKVATTTVPVAPPTPAPVPVLDVTVGNGAHALVLSISEDAWSGDAHYTVSVDGKQLGGTMAATAAHAAGAFQAVTVLGDFAPGAHTASITFLDDAYGGSATTDRNLYLSGATIDGKAVAGANAALMSSGSSGFGFDVAAPPAAQNTLHVKVSEDPWSGDAQFTVKIDGAMIGGVRTATASHAAGASQDVSLTGTWGSGAHVIEVAFLNDAYGGSASTDRNLYVDSVSYDGRTAGGPATLLSAGTVTFTAPGAPVGALVNVGLSEDAWMGDAQYAISVDGGLAKSGLVTASQKLGQSQSVNVAQSLSSGSHDVAVSFLNDAYGGPNADRNMHVTGITLNGAAVNGSTADLWSAGTIHLTVVVPTA